MLLSEFLVLNDDGDLRKKARIRKEAWNRLINGWDLLSPKAFENVVKVLGGDSEEKKKVISAQLLKCHLAHQSPNKKLEFTLHIKPQPCPRPRFSKWSGAYMPKTYKAYQKSIGMMLGGFPKIEGLCEIEVGFYLKTVKHPYGYHTTQKDIDNLLKALFDSFQEYGLIENDKQIHTVKGVKYWHPKDKIHTIIRYNDWYGLE